MGAVVEMIMAERVGRERASWGCLQVEAYLGETAEQEAHGVNGSPADRGLLYRTEGKKVQKL